MQKPKILFISLYDRTASSIRTLHSVLKKEGYTSAIIFFKELLYNQMRKPTKKELNLLIKNVKELDPEFICLSVRSPFFEIAKEISNLIKNNFNKPLIWGGSHATIVPEECINYADIVCVGEGEYALVELLNKTEKNEKTDNIQNLWIKKGNKIIKNPFRNLIANLDEIPYFDYSDTNKYVITNNKLTKGDPIVKNSKYYPLVGRGCPFSCTYCCNSYFNKLFKGKGKIVRKRSVDNLIEELMFVKKNFKNVREIYFSDDVFSMDEKWIVEFAEEYKKIRIPFGCMFHPSNINDKIVSSLKSVGMVSIQIGIQSGSQRVREQIYKRFTSDESILKAANIIKKYGLIPNYDIILDNIYETEDDKEKSINFLLKLPRPYNLNMFSLTNFPKTELTERLIADNYIPNPGSKKALSQWRMTFNVKRDRVNTFYNCLVSLLSKSFVHKSLIKFFSKSKYLKNNPHILIVFVKASNHIKLMGTAIRVILTGRMSIARFIYHLKNYKGITL